MVAGKRTLGEEVRKRRGGTATAQQRGGEWSPKGPGIYRSLEKGGRGPAWSGRVVHGMTFHRTGPRTVKPKHHGGRVEVSGVPRPLETVVKRVPQRWEKGGPQDSSGGGKAGDNRGTPPQNENKGRQGPAQPSPVAAVQ
ncbi:hypothetical protein NDU88_005102 [Pleurodeles waltl]|uniref:Uncharacterized protein n=1 Tax=Pleurodeles waltl TaxID=8319 RepID=A0AAV7QE23_PLEWA|nr:hypothetical protein NDU88_005102 [Pleurodeles waltl]